MSASGEDLKRLLVKCLHDALDGTATVIRNYEEIPFSSPEVGVKFTETSRPVYQFLADAFGEEPTRPYIKRCKIYENRVRIRVVAREPLEGGTNTARKTVISVENTVKETIRKEWKSILEENGGCLYRYNDLVFRNASFIHEQQRFVARTITFSILLREEWNYIPEDESDRAVVAATVNFTVK